jgi:hypothetical protein
MTGPLLVLTALLGLQTGTDLPHLVLPAGQDAWVVRIVTSGGLTGRGAGQVTASSAGTLLCAPAVTCPDRLSASTHDVITRFVASLPVDTVGAAAPDPFPTGICSDCVATTMTVRHRDASGERTLTYTWDVSTAAAVPEDLRRLAATIRAALPR